MQTIFNSGFTDDSVVYDITPVANGCSGQTKYYAILVHPAANVNVNAAGTSICSGTQTNIYLSSNFAGTTFNWTVIAPGTVTGAVAGNGTSIIQTLSSRHPAPKLFRIS